MGGSKRTLLENEINKLAKAEQMPEQVDMINDLVLEQTKLINQQKETITHLQAEVRVANSFKSKIKDWLFGGVIGTLLTLLTGSLISLIGGAQ